jgi:hypothetical protein
MRYHQDMRACHYSRGFVVCVSLLALVGCEEDTDSPKVLDAVVETADGLFTTIETDTTWQLAITDPEVKGFQLDGELVNGDGGTLKAFGWRNTTQFDNESGTYLSFGEKLFVDLASWNANGMNLTGRLVITRHSMDFGPSGSLNDVSRTTRYVGSITAEGAVSGSFDLDVNASASGKTLWTCGVINGEGVELGECYGN